MTERIAVLLLALVPGIGVGGTIVELFSLLRDLADDMRGSRGMCTQVVERIQFLCNHVEMLQNRRVLEHNNVLPKLAETILHFKTLMEEHSTKGTLSRYLARHEIADQILAFSSDLDAISLTLNLTTAAEIAEMRVKFDENQARDHKLIVEILANMHALKKEYPGRSLVEALNEVQFAIKRSGSANTPLLAAEDVALLKQTMQAMAKQSNLQLAALPPWYLPSDHIQCPAKYFAKGTYGTVHRGTWNGTNVVIKKLLVPVEDRKIEETFQHEVAIWHSLARHPHVVQLFGACHASAPPFFVCEDATHGNFVDFFGKRAANKERQLWRRFYEAALGLTHLHTNNVVHGDLKCCNLLVGADGLAKICDFGFSFIQSASRAVSVKAQTDAARWKALECSMGEEHTPQNPQFKSDVYSLGMCIIEAVSGKEPWDGLDEDAILAALMNGERHVLPEALTHKQRELVEAMTAIDAMARMPLSDALKELKALAGEEEALYPSRRVCPECHVESNGSAKFCSGCGHRFTGSEARVLPVL